MFAIVYPRGTRKPTFHSLPGASTPPRSGLYLANLTRPKEPHPKVRTLGWINISTRWAQKTAISKVVITPEMTPFTHLDGHLLRL